MKRIKIPILSKILLTRISVLVFIIRGQKKLGNLNDSNFDKTYSYIFNHILDKLTIIYCIRLIDYTYIFQKINLYSSLP